jgi:hypothetical protein
MTHGEGGTTPKRHEPYSFEKLEVWRLAEDIIVRVYGLARGLPESELYGIAGQMRRAAVSRLR